MSNRKSKRMYTSDDVKRLGEELLSSKLHVNNLPLLASFISPKFPPECVIESIISLQSFFVPVLPTLPASKSHVGVESKDAEGIYNAWLRSKFDELIKLMIDFIVSELADNSLKEVMLGALMEFVKLGKEGRFNLSIYHRLLLKLIDATEPDDFSLNFIASKYFKFIDICYFTYISLGKIARMLEMKGEHDACANIHDKDHHDGSPKASAGAMRQLFTALSLVPALEDLKEASPCQFWSKPGLPFRKRKLLEDQGVSEKDMFLNSAENSNSTLDCTNLRKKLKLKFTKTWTAFLGLQLPVDIYKEVLTILHDKVIPHLSSPILLCDFLTRSYDMGGVVSVMALSGLFILMTQHGLEYPCFYEKLYALLEPSIFLAKHRAKFFELLDTCLKSPLLPAYMAAAFAKKLSRLALAVPPHGGLVIIALIHNLLRRHPSINCLVHQEGGESENVDYGTGKENLDDVNETAPENETAQVCRGVDHFKIEEKDLANSNALKSSLWEINTLRHHYCPPVSRFVESLESDLTNRAKTTEVNIRDFSPASYATIFEEEMRRRVKQVPLAFYRTTPTSLFSASDFEGWSFESGGNTGDSLDTAAETNISSAKRQRIAVP